MAKSTMMSAVTLNSRTQTSTNLNRLLDECRNISLIGTTSHSDYALELLVKFKPDIFFLDEEIWQEGSLFSIEELSKKYPGTYFVLIRGFLNKTITTENDSCRDYLFSPFNREQLFQIIERKRANDRIAALQSQMELLSKERKHEKIILTTKTEFLFINPGNIVFCKAESNYTSITLLDRKPVLITKSLCHFYKEALNLPEFIRISRSVVINKLYLTEVVKAERKCLLEASGKTYSFTVSPEYYKILRNNNFSRIVSLNKTKPSHTNMLSLLNKSNWS